MITMVNRNIRVLGLNLYSGDVFSNPLPSRQDSLPVFSILKVVHVQRYK